jgi:precorrin-6Y C5,15-methyltransferase (decarboxylating)
MVIDAKGSPAGSRPWLTIVGVGADGEASLAPRAREAIERAEFVAGSERQLSLVRACIRGETHVWPSPLADGIASIIARRGRTTCVLASGDPFWFGIGATFAARLSSCEIECHPAPSSMSLAAARLGWPLQEVDIVSLHGRNSHALIRHLQPGRRVLALSWDRDTPRKLCALLRERGFGPSRMHVLEHLGAPDERIRSALADDADWSVCADLNLVALELAAAAHARIIPCRGSLEDAAFEHDGQLTKQDIRALTLSALAPRAGALLWDIGAGAGSISIEWMLSHVACLAVAIEREPERCARIRRNADKLGVPGLRIVHADAPKGLGDLPTPDAVFIGGGGADPDIFAVAWQALRSGGRLVMNAVALETEALLVSLFREHGGSLRRICIESAEALGTMTGWKPARSVMQWRVVKP